MVLLFFHRETESAVFVCELCQQPFPKLSMLASVGRGTPPAASGAGHPAASPKVLGRGTFGCVFTAARCSADSGGVTKHLFNFVDMVEELQGAMLMAAVDPAGSFHTRLLHECRVAANVCKLEAEKSLSSQKCCKQYALQFEFGGTVLSAVTKRDTLNLAEIKDWTKQLCEAMHTLHAHGIVHGDMKSDNMCLHDDGRIRLIDFGMTSFGSSWKNKCLAMSHDLAKVNYFLPELTRQGEDRSNLWNECLEAHGYIYGTLLHRDKDYKLQYR